MQIHELNTFQGEPSQTDYLAIDTGQETCKIPARSLGVTENMTVEEATAGLEEASRVIQPEVFNEAVKAIATPPGIIEMYAGADAPTGWLICDGRAISRTDYAALFNIIGTTYGSGNGSTTFNIPDLRDRFPVGAGSTYSRNSKGGAASVKLSDEEMAHGHGFTQPSITSYLSATVSYGSGSSTRPYSESGSTGTTAAWAKASGGAVQNLSGASSTRTAHENRPPYIGLNFIISTGE